MIKCWNWIEIDFENDNLLHSGLVLSGPSTGGLVSPGDDGTQLSMLTVLVGWILIAMILYFLRPNSWRRRSETKKHSNGGNDDRDGDRDRLVL